MKSRFHALGRCRALAALAMFAAGSARLSARAANDEVANQTPIELPKFVVTDSRELPPPESWQYGKMEGFEILSNASARSTQRLLADFQLFRQALSVVWPTASQPGKPVLLILCGHGGKYDAFVPPKTEGTPDTANASLFLKDGSNTAIVIDLESSVISLQSLDVDDPASGTDSTQFSIDHNKQLYREYVHYLLSKSQPRLPAWFEEGMSQIIMAMKFTPDYIEFGKLEDANTVSAQAGMVADLNSAASADPEADDSSSIDMIAGAPVEDKDFNAVMSKRRIMDMDKFFAVSYDSPAARNPLGNNTWSKQAYEFVHMGLYGENGKWQKPFTQFLIRSTREPVTEQMFKDCFKMSYKDMQMQLRLYAQFTQYKSMEFTAKKGSSLRTPPPVVLRDATQSEVGRIKGEALLMANHPDAARNEFRAPYIRGERDPELLAALGLAERADGKDDRARKFLTAAVDGKTTNPDAYIELAKMRFADAVAAPAGPNKQFSPEQVTSVTSLLMASRKLPPLNAVTYELWADTLANSSARPQKDDVIPLVQGVRLFPGRMKLIYTTAGVCADAGLLDAAHSLAEHGIKHAPDATTKANFEKLNAALPPVAANTPPPAAPTATPQPVTK